jgi:hypothetical protein
VKSINGTGDTGVQVELEQYPTGPHIASRMLFTVILSSFSFFLFVFPSFSIGNSLFALVLVRWVRYGNVELQLALVPLFHDSARGNYETLRIPHDRGVVPPPPICHMARVETRDCTSAKEKSS